MADVQVFGQNLPVPMGNCGYGFGGYNGYNNNDKDCLSELILANRIGDAQTDINANISSARSDISTHGINNLGATHNSTIASLNAIHDSETSTGDRVTQHGISNLKETSDVGRRVVDTIHDKGDRISDRIDASDNNTNNRLDFIRNTLEHNFQTLNRNHFDLTKEVLEVKHNTTLRVLESENRIQRELADVRLENAKCEGRTRELLLQTTNETQKQIAECCCENKLLTAQQSAETRELFAKQENSTKILLLEQQIENLRHRDEDNRRRYSDINITNEIHTAVRSLARAS